MKRAGQIRITARVEDDPRSITPNFWWTRRLVSLLIIALFGLVSFRWIWNRIEDRKLTAAIARMLADGPAHLPPAPALADDDNAAVWILRAAKAGENTLRYDHEGGAPIPTPEQADAIVASNSKVLELLHRARNCSRADWKDWDRFGRIFEPFNAAGLSIRVAHAHRRDDDAIQTALDLLAAAHACTQRESMAGFWNSERARGELDFAIQNIVETLAFENAPPMRRESVRAVIDGLLDETDFEDRYFLMSRNLALEFVGDASSSGVGRTSTVWSEEIVPTGGFRVLDWIAQPYDRAHLTRMIDNWTHWIDALQAPDAPTFRARNGGMIRQPLAPLSAFEPAQWLMVNAWDRQVVSPTSRYFPRARDRLAALALAAALYQREHRGRVPTDQNALVPDYLPHIVADPYLAGGKPLAIVDLGAGGAFVAGAGLDERQDVLFSGYVPPWTHEFDPRAIDWVIWIRSPMTALAPIQLR